MDGRTLNWAKRIGDLANGVVMDTYNRVLSKVFGKGKFMWYTTRDEIVCEVCRYMHGTVFSFEEIKRGILPAHPGCRCTWVRK